jgi:hypothetical protein
MASLHASPTASQSIVGALEGACELAETSGFVSGDTIACGEAMSWVCGGADWEDVADEFGDEIADWAVEEVGNLFKGISRGLKKVAKKGDKVLTSKPGKALAFLPGGRAYMLARGATKAASTKGNVIQKARGGASGTLRGASDYLQNPVVRQGASMFGLSKMTEAADKAAAAADRIVRPGAKLSAKNMFSLARQGAELLPTGEMQLPDGIKLPNGLRLPQGGRLKLKGVKLPPAPLRKFCFEQ